MRISIVDPDNIGKITKEHDHEDLYELSADICNHNWSPSHFGPSGVRSNENWSSCGLLVLDIDSGLTLKKAKDTFKKYAHIIATTRSHQKPKHGDVQDRFRVILFLDRPCDKLEDYAATWSCAYSMWPFIDDACKDPARFYYPCTDVFIVEPEGQRFCVVKGVTTPPATAMAQPRAVKGELWKSTLEFLLKGAGPGTRWRRLNMAAGNMKDQGYTEQEVISEVSKMIVNGGSWEHKKLTEKDLKVIKGTFTRGAKYEFKAKEDSEVDVVSFLDLKEEIMSSSANLAQRAGTTSGFAGLDDMLGGGLRHGELTVLMAQAKTGKNVLLHNILFRSITAGIPYGYASREMRPSDEVFRDLLSMLLKKNKHRETITEAERAMADEWPVYFAHGLGYMSHDQTERFFESCRCMGIEHFIYDHFHRGIQFEGYEQTERHIRFLKGLTTKWDCHLTLVVQPKLLQEGQQLGLDSLRGGAIIGQELNNLLTMVRMKDQINVSKLTLEAARHRLCKPGKIYLKYDPETILMTEIDRGSVSDAPQEKDAPKARWEGPRVK